MSLVAITDLRQRNRLQTKFESPYNSQTDTNLIKKKIKNIFHKADMFVGLHRLYLSVIKYFPFGWKDQHTCNEIKPKLISFYWKIFLMGV